MKTRILIGFGFVLAVLASAFHLARAGAFGFPLLADDYIFAYRASFHAPTPEWAPALLPYWRPLSRDAILQLALSGGVGSVPAVHVLGFALVALAAACQLAAWRRLGASPGTAYALVVAFLLASWQTVLVGWASALQDGVAVLGVSAAIWFAASARPAFALGALVAGLLAKESALVAAPVVAVIALAHIAKGRARTRALQIGAGVLGLWAVCAWLARPPASNVAPGNDSAIGGAWERALCVVPTFANLADLPAKGAQARIDFLGPLLLLGLAIIALAMDIAMRHRSSSARAPERGEARRAPGSGRERARRAGPGPHAEVAVPFLWQAWLASAALVVGGAAWLPYPWSSYLIAPVWPALVAPLAAQRASLRPNSEKLRTSSAKRGIRPEELVTALLVLLYAVGASIQARIPDRKFSFDVPTLASYWSPGRLWSLAAVVLPLERAAKRCGDPEAGQYLVGGTPRLVWHALGSGLAGALWAKRPDARALETWHLRQIDPDQWQGCLILSGRLYGGEPAVLPAASFRRLRAVVLQFAAIAPENLGGEIARLENDREWRALPEWQRGHMLLAPATEARRQGRDAIADSLLLLGCRRYGGLSCCHTRAAELLRAGRAREAVALLGPLVETNKDQGDTGYYLALAYDLAGEPARAREALLRGRELGFSPEIAAVIPDVERQLGLVGPAAP